MTTTAAEPAQTMPVILFLDDDVISRCAIAAYLRECGHQVIEAANVRETKEIISARKYAVDIAICATNDLQSADRFELSHWIRDHHPDIRILIAATVEKTAKLAADICEEGPHLRKPYEHQALLDWIKRLRS